MISARTTILNKLGLHARPAMAFVQMASAQSSEVRVRRAESSEWLDGKSIMQMLLLAATEGTEIEIECDGTDEQETLARLLQLIVSKFDEE